MMGRCYNNCCQGMSAACHPGVFVAAISIRFDQQADALREARRLAADAGTSVYVVRILEAEGRPWEVHDALPKNRPWQEVAPDDVC